MKPPYWLRRRPGLVTFTIAADVSRFADAMRRAAVAADLMGLQLREAGSATGYRLRVAGERARAFAWLEDLLDQTCRDLGLDPNAVRRGAQPTPIYEQTRVDLERTRGSARGTERRITDHHHRAEETT